MVVHLYAWHYHAMAVIVAISVELQKYENQHHKIKPYISCPLKSNDSYVWRTDRNLSHYSPVSWTRSVNKWLFPINNLICFTVTGHPKCFVLLTNSMIAVLQLTAHRRGRSLNDNLYSVCFSLRYEFRRLEYNAWFIWPLLWWIFGA